MSTDTPVPTTDADESTADDQFDFAQFTLRASGFARRVDDPGDGWCAHEKAWLSCERPVRDLDEFLRLVGTPEYEFDEVVDYLLDGRDGYEIGPHDPREWEVTVEARVGVWERFILAAAEIEPDQWHGATSIDDALSWANNTAQRPVADPRLFLALASLWGDRGRDDKRGGYVEQYQAAVGGDDDD